MAGSLPLLRAWQELVDVSDEEVYVIGGIVDRSAGRLGGGGTPREAGQANLPSDGMPE